MSSKLEITREDFNQVSCQLRMDIYNFGDMLGAADDISFMEDDLIGEDKYSMLILAGLGNEDFSLWLPHMIVGMDSLMHYFRTRGKIANCQVYDLGERGYEVRCMISNLTAIECNEVVPSFNVDFKLSSMDKSTHDNVKQFYETEKPEKPISLSDLQEFVDGIDNLED